jgi:hypothetical protein
MEERSRLKVMKAKESASASICRMEISERDCSQTGGGKK